MKDEGRNRSMGRYSNFVKGIGWTGPDARKAPHAALFENDDRPFWMGSTGRIRFQWKQCLKRTVHDAQVTPRAIVFDDGHHGLTHELMERATAIILCLQN
jgi:hypothetical protein